MVSLLFDFDGVIADSFDVFRRRFERGCSALGLTVPTDRDSLLRLFDGNFFERVRDLGVPAASMAAFLERVCANLPGEEDAIGLQPGMADVLRQLSTRTALTIVTSNRSPLVLAVLRRHGLAACAQEVLGADTDTSKVHKIARAMGSAGAPCFFIGDTRGDMLEGRAAGAATVAVGWGWHSIPRLLQARPDYLAVAPGNLCRLPDDTGWAPVGLPVR